MMGDGGWTPHNGPPVLESIHLRDQISKSSRIWLTSDIMTFHRHAETRIYVVALRVDVIPTYNQ